MSHGFPAPSAQNAAACRLQGNSCSCSCQVHTSWIAEAVLHICMASLLVKRQPPIYSSYVHNTHVKFVFTICSVFHAKMFGRYTESHRCDLRFEESGTSKEACGGCRQFDYGPGGIVGELDFFLQQARSFQAVCRDSCTLLCISR